MYPKDLQIKEFNYYLPDEKIAKYPLKKRDSSKLLIYQHNAISEDIFSNLGDHLPPDAILIFNNTKVVEARLFFEKETGAIIEIFCLEPAEKYPDLATAMLEKSAVVWKCLVGNVKKWKDELLRKRIFINTTEITLIAKKVRKQDDVVIVEFSWNNQLVSFAEILHAAGVIPLPPYLHREAEKSDAQNYQTVYARKSGSVAAPTAGLHFTKELFEKLRRQKIALNFITLHVGAGTFMPVKSDTIRQHAMHAEYFEVGKEFIEQLLNTRGDHLIAVGTTTLRTLESLYWMGVKLIQASKENIQTSILAGDIEVTQWEPYELPANIPVQETLQALVIWMNENKLAKLTAKTQIIIAPPYALKIGKGLVTNFHQPKSTLLLLVAAIIGNDWKKVYDYALNNNFRFLSYGDGCLFFSA